MVYVANVMGHEQNVIGNYRHKTCQPSLEK